MPAILQKNGKQCSSQSFGFREAQDAPQTFPAFWASVYHAFTKQFPERLEAEAKRVLDVSKREQGEKAKPGEEGGGAERDATPEGEKRDDDEQDLMKVSHNSDEGRETH